MTTLKLHTETPPPHSLLACKCVVYELDGKKYRCSEKSWPTYMAEVLERQQREIGP